MFKSGFISIVGKPNAGKSTLINKLMGEKIAIVSSKPQTTRTKITGVYTDEEAQLVFVDTPGMHNARNKLGEFMNREVKLAASDVDVILYLVDITAKDKSSNSELIEMLPVGGATVFLVINKIDLAAKEDVLPVISQLKGLYNFAEIVPLSAQKGTGVESLISEIKKYMPEGPKYFPDDTLTDQPERVIVAEIIREKLFRLLNDEIPFGTAVELEKMTYDEDRDITEISAVIYCEKASHKGMIIGKGGAMLKRIGTEARRDIERLVDGKVFLKMWVKVEDDWRNKNSAIKNLGYVAD
ncbi:MAG: GTPase Era [Eubacteriales bacterium]|nr:GTPase Era [Eubacteriales bacterium]